MENKNNDLLDNDDLAVCFSLRFVLFLIQNLWSALEKFKISTPEHGRNYITYTDFLKAKEEVCPKARFVVIHESYLRTMLRFLLDFHDATIPCICSFGFWHIVVLLIVFNSILPIRVMFLSANILIVLSLVAMCIYVYEWCGCKSRQCSSRNLLLTFQKFLHSNYFC